MTNAFTAAVQSLQNDLQTMDAISQNMVNVATPGYKREIPVAKIFDNAMQAAGQTEGAPAIAGFNASVGTAVDLSVGPVKHTGNLFDIAITGDGFFEVAAPSGMGYSRAGDFHLDAGGRLVTQGGFAVQGQHGDIVVNGSNVAIDHTGNVTQDGETVDRLRIVQFKNVKALTKSPEGLLHASDAAGAGTEVTPEVQVGYLESSNVLPVREMISMMETIRHFEASQKLYQGYDETMRTAIQKLGEF